MKRALQRLNSLVRNDPLLIWIICLLSFAKGFCCSDFILKSADGAVVNGRSMDFSDIVPLDFKFKAHPKGESQIAEDPRMMSWIAQYNFVSIEALDGFIVDGLNEKGLSFAYLWLEDTVYPKYNSGQKALALKDVGAYLLGNFDTIEQVRQIFPDLVICGQVIDSVGYEPPLHISLHDAQGASLVVEFIEGKLKLYNNPFGVLANEPPFEHHIRGIEKGTRFEQLVAYRKNMLQLKEADMAVTVAFHILNTFDIPFGDGRKAESPNGDKFYYTMWTLVKDLTNRRVFFRTHGDINLKLINLNDLDFAKKGTFPLTETLEGVRFAEDITHQLQ